MKLFKIMRRRGLALFLVLTMCLSLLQVTAFAADEGESETPQTPEVTEPASGTTEQTPEEKTDPDITGETENSEEITESEETEETTDSKEPEGTEDSEITEGTEETSEESDDGIIQVSEEDGNTEENQEPSESVTSFLEAVEAIPAEVTTEDEETIIAAREAYEALTEDEKNLDSVVTALETLTAAEAALEEAKRAEETPEDPISFDEETGTLSISGMADVTKDDVQKILTDKGITMADVQNLVLDVTGDIAGYAFYMNATLKSVTIRNAASIGDRAFFKCPNLETVELTNVGTIGGNAFAESKALATVSLNEVRTVGDEAFRQCSAMITLNLTSVKEFGRSPFSYCIGLAQLSLDGGESGIVLGTTMFYGCTGLTEVTLKNIDSIPLQMFNGCTSLKSVILENVTDIGNQVFYGCTGLETVSMTEIGTIGSSIFQNCTSEMFLTLNDVATIGEQAFVSSKGIKTVKMKNIGTIGKNAFASCTGLTSVEMDNVDTIGQYAFYNCTGLKTVTMGSVQRIDNYAFWNCSALTSIDLNAVTGSIGGFAFYGCKDLNNLSVKNLIAKLGYVGTSEEIMARVQAILADKFQLENATEIRALKLEGWTAGAVGQSSNWDQYNNGTQLMEQARWEDTSTGVAEVKVDAYYTAEKQMDYIFVADLSASMAQLGNPEDNNARFYDMQSKLLDMTGKLLGTAGYDCQVAIVTFGGEHQNNATCTTMEFTDSIDSAQAHIATLEPLNENTDYGLGLQAAKELATKNKNAGRNTVVVFLSDGAPNRGTSGDMDGTTAAAEIKALGVDIYGVLHSPTAGQHDKALANMQAVCSAPSTEDEKTVYESTDTESFGAAMNAAFAAAYGNNTVTVPVNAENFNVNGLRATAGEVSYENGVITWTINGMPFTQHTLTYQMALKPEYANRIGSYSYGINNGDATFGASDATVDVAKVGLNLTLTRTVNPPEPTTAAYTVRHEYYTNNVRDGDPVEETFNAAIGSVISAENITRITEHNGNTYTYTSASGDVTVIADGSAVITLRYDRTVSTEPETPVTPVIPVTPPTGGTTITPNPTPLAPTPGTTINDENVPLANVQGLNTTEHYAYVKGYNDGTVRPLDNISRAEVATIFFRLMTEEYRVANWSVTNSFTDANPNDWYNAAISTSARAGLIKGDPDGRVRPDDYITHAEFVTLAARFASDDLNDEGVGDFKDTEGFWAAKEIRMAAKAGWITWVENGYFRPDEHITRAEVMAMINRMLDRVPDAEHMLDGMKTWSDNPVGTSYYADVQEATNDHQHEPGEDGVTEIWTELTEAKDWDALLVEWTANNGASAK